MNHSNAPVGVSDHSLLGRFTSGLVKERRNDPATSTPRLGSLHRRWRNPLRCGLRVLRLSALLALLSLVGLTQVRAEETVRDDNEPRPTVTVPGPPRDLEARASGDFQIDLSGAAPTDDGGGAITGYRIEWLPDGEFDWSVLVENTNSTQTTFSGRLLHLGRARYIRVLAINSAGIGPPSKVSHVKPLRPPVDPPPSDPPASDPPPNDPPAPELPELPEVTIAAETTSVVEGSEATFTLSRTGDTLSSVALSLDVSETGSMIDGVAPTSAVFDAGESRTTLTVPTIDDSIDEPDSEISVTLIAGPDAGYVIGSGSSAIVTVRDDDQPRPIVTVPGPPKDFEARASGDFQIDLSWATPTDDGGGAITGYRIEWLAHGEFDWSVLVENTNSTQTTFSGRFLHMERARYLRVLAINSAGIGPPSKVSHVKPLRPPVDPPPVDPPPTDPPAPELPEVTIAAETTSVVEGSEVTFTLSRTGDTLSSVTLSLDVSETGSMIDGVAPTSAVFDAGESRTTLTVPTIDDSIEEADSEISVTLIAGPDAGYVIGSVASAAVTVSDDDQPLPVDPPPSDPPAPGLPEVTIVAGPSPITEGTTASFTLTRTGTASEELTVSVEVVESGAMISGTPPASVVFAATETQTELMVATDQDNLDERNSSILATVLGAEDAAYEVGRNGFDLVLVQDDDSTVLVQLTTEVVDANGDAVTEVREDAGTVTVRVTAMTEGSDAPLVALKFRVDSQGVSATAYEDYAPVGVVGQFQVGDWTFDAVEQRHKATADVAALAIIDDSLAEPREVLLIHTDEEAGGPLGVTFPEPVEFTIVDNDGLLAAGLPAAPTDLEATADGSAAIDLRWNAPSEAANSAVTGYRIEWSSDGESEWSVLVDDTDSTRTTLSDRDLTAGTTRYYRACALNAAGVGPPSNVARAKTILALPEVTVQAVKSPVVEGAEAAFTLRRTGATAEPLTVSLEVSATAPMPGSEPPTSALFPAGADETTLTVRTIDDSVDEPDREIATTLLNGNGYTLGSAVSATVLVRDNDGAPVLSITGAAAPESRGNLVFVVTLQGRTTMPVEAAWSTSPGTATADQDYATVSGVLTLDPGLTGGAIVIPLRDDAILEENETFTVSLSRPKNAELEVGASSATGVIENDDAAPVIRIADASAPESAGEIGFTVSLSGESALPATVRWATEAETAQPGIDYVEVSGELVLGGGATSVRLEVPLIEDLLHEESETFRLVLSGATNAVLDGDSEVAATGTIEDDGDSAPAEEWLARFGRTAASNAVDALQDRLTGRLGSGSQVVVAGHRVDVSGSGPEHGAAGSAAAPVTGLGSIGQAAGGAVGLAVPGGGLLDTQSGRYGSGRMSVGDVLARSSFRFSPDTHGAGRGNGTTGAGAVEGGVSADHRWSVWGSGASTRFDGGEDTLSLNGEVVTGTVGADIERGRALFGVAVSHSRGDGDYRRNGVGGLHAREGSLSSELTTGLPYLRVAVNDRLSVWGALGRGSGSMTLGEGDPGSVETDIGMTLGAFGARQELRPSAATEGFRLALRTDLLLVHTTSDETEALPALSTDVNRLRLMIEGARRWQFDSGVVLTPTVELGLRYDDGDAETGGGLEVGAGLRLENAARGLSAELTGRSLLAHQASELSEWGVGGSLRFEPGGGDRGLSIGLRSTLGAASSGITRLWEQQNAAPSAYRPAPGSGSGNSSPWKLKPLAWSGVTRRRPFSGRRSWRTFAGRRRSPEHLGEDYGTGGRGLGRFRSCSALDRLSALSGSRSRPSSDPWSHPRPPRLSHHIWLSWHKNFSMIRCCS